MSIKKIAIALGAVALISAGSTFAATSDKTTVEIKPTNLVNTLSLQEGIVISAEDITNAKANNKAKVIDLGTFCTYTNHPKKQLTVKVTNNENGYNMLGQGGIGKVEYSLSLNGTTLPYAKDHTFTPNGGTNHIDCKTTEAIEMTIPAANLAAAKAGTYDVSFNLAVSDIKS